MKNNFAHLLPPTLRATIADWLNEDMPSFDYGGFVVGDKEEHAILYCKSTGVLAGSPFFEAVFEVCGCSVEWKCAEGDFIRVEDDQRVEVAHVRGPSYRLLQGERLALNILARSAGIATRAYRMLQLKQSCGWNGTVAGTRKTTPGFRMVEKYAMIVGGVDSHRLNLSSMIMLKDNHIWSQGSITEAVKKAKLVGGFSLKIEVECRSLEEALEAIEAGADIVMLDNFEPVAASETASKLKQRDSKVLIEVSGGLTEDNMDAYMQPSIDILSSGSLTQGCPHVDFSLKIQKS